MWKTRNQGLSPLTKKIDSKTSSRESCLFRVSTGPWKKVLKARLRRWQLSDQLWSSVLQHETLIFSPDRQGLISSDFQFVSSKEINGKKILQKAEFRVGLSSMYEKIRYSSTMTHWTNSEEKAELSGRVNKLSSVSEIERCTYHSRLHLVL